MLEGTVHPHAEERRLVRQVPVDIVCGGFLCGEPVVVVMLGLAYAPLLELVAVPETTLSTVTNWGRIQFALIRNIHIHILCSYSYLSTLDFSSHSS